jgi:hypothetical protein
MYPPTPDGIYYNRKMQISEVVAWGLGICFIASLLCNVYQYLRRPSSLREDAIIEAVQRTTNELVDTAGGQSIQQTAVRFLISIANGQTVSRVLARVTATRLQAEIARRDCPARRTTRLATRPAARRTHSTRPAARRDCPARRTTRPATRPAARRTTRPATRPAAGRTRRDCRPIF